jgi:hypothetical protein
MRLFIRSAILAALVIAPASAMAWVWPWPAPSLPEEAARTIAWQHGIVTITDIDPTIDGDWDVEGTDAWGHEVELEIDGATGAIEHAEMNED